MIRVPSEVAQVPERKMGGVAIRNDVSDFGKSPVRGLNLATETFGKDAALFFGNEVDEFAVVINFELVPSGKIHMNREAREHIVDFFQ